MNKQRIALILLSIIGIISTQLPWAKALLVFKIKGTSTDLVYVIVIFAIPIILSFIGNIKKILPRRLLWIVRICFGLASFVGVFAIIYIKNSAGAKVDIGAWLMALTAILGFFISILQKK